METIKLSTLLFNKRKIRNLVHNKRLIYRAVLNGVVIWEKEGGLTPSIGYISVDDTLINLSNINSYTQNTMVRTNRDFDII